MLFIQGQSLYQFLFPVVQSFKTETEGAWQPGRYREPFWKA